VGDAALDCDWVGTPVSFQRCLVFIIAAANKEFTLTAGKFVPVCNKTMMNVREIFLNYILIISSNLENKLWDTMLIIIYFQNLFNFVIHFMTICSYSP